MQTKQMIDSNIKKITLKLNQIKKCQNQLKKKTSIHQLTQLCGQTLQIIDQDDVKVNNNRKKTQIYQILQLCQEIQQKDKQKTITSQSQELYFDELAKVKKLNNIKESPTLNQEQQMYRKSINISRQIVQYQLDQKKCKYSSQQIDEIAKRFLAIKDIQQLIHKMIIQQGYNLDQVRKNLEQVYKNSQNANHQLNQAAKLINQNRKRKFKLGFSGVFATFGLAFLGIPGMIAGFIGGMFITK